MRDVLDALHELVQRGQRCALATVVRTTGSTPNRAGARLLLRADGTITGTVGGGAVEHMVIEALRAALASGESALVSSDLGHDLGMCCGGRMDIFVEVIEPAPELYLFGAGHVAEATAAIARTAGFAITVVDEREEQNTEARFPGCRRDLRDPPSFLRRARLGANDWLLIATHDHALDEQTLELALDQPVRYIGLVGSVRKVYRLLQRITHKRGPTALDRVYAPVGLDLGALGPQEIAVSIVAELVALRRGKAASHLRAVHDARLQALLAREPSSSDTK